MCHCAEVKKTGPGRNTRQTKKRKGRNTGMEVFLASRDYRIDTKSVSTIIPVDNFLIKKVHLN